MLLDSSGLDFERGSRPVQESTVCDGREVSSGHWSWLGLQGERCALRDIVVLDNVLSEEECSEFICLAEQKQFSVPPQCESCSDPSTLKDSTRVDIANLDDTAAQIWYRIQDYLPPLISDEANVEWEFIGLNNFLRVARYEGAEKQQFGKHFDGINKDLGLMKPAGYLGKKFLSPDNGQVQTMLALHFFLNDRTSDFNGGRMVFYHEDKEWFSVSPIAGRLVIFRQGENNGLLHCGEMVELKDGNVNGAERPTFGKKYVLRTDAIYRRTA
ncbi:MAG: hypothetical protein CMJ62_19725 [Planctomycetaceae bacterium]|nr:hypothetical protein [Planctomycetaceae bacterium]